VKSDQRLEKTTSPTTDSSATLQKALEDLSRRLEDVKVNSEVLEEYRLSAKHRAEQLTAALGEVRELRTRVAELSARCEKLSAQRDELRERNRDSESRARTYKSEIARLRRIVRRREVRLAIRFGRLVRPTYQRMRARKGDR
jgi:chromosome segregation ATPase